MERVSRLALTGLTGGEQELLSHPVAFGRRVTIVIKPRGDAVGGRDRAGETLTLGLWPRQLHLRWRCLVLVNALLASCGPEAPDKRPLGPEDAAAVRRISEEYGRAWLADDTAAVMALFTEDAVLIPHLGNPQLVGKAAIRDHFWPPGSPPARVIRFERRSLEVRGIGATAWDRGSYTLAFVYAGDTLGNSGNYLAVAERGSDGRWRWSAYSWNHR